MRHAEILFGVTGQHLVLDPTELVRPTSPSVQVFRRDAGDDSTAELAISGAATVDTVDTTLAADAFAGAEELELAAGTSIAKGGAYLLTSAATGLAERVDVLAIVGTRVVLQRPLVNNYAAGSTFEGVRITAALDTTWLSDLAKLNGDALGASYRVRWTYTADAPTVAVTYFDLVRYRASSLVTARDIDNRFPGWIDRLPPDHRANQGASLIVDALDAVKMDALGDAKVLYRIRDTQVLRELLILKANLLAVQNQVIAGGANLDGVTIARDLYTQRYQQLLVEPKVPIDNTSSGAGARAASLPVWSK